MNVCNSKRLLLTICLLAVSLGPWKLHANCDVDNDGKEGLAEAIHALQVIAGIGGLQSHTPAPVHKTGQESCYDDDSATTGTINCDGTGQDGEHQKGVPWPAPRFTDNTDGTVMDNLTGLIWLKEANCIFMAIPWFDTDDTPGDGIVFRSTALVFIDSLNTGEILRSTVGMVPLSCGDISNDGNPQNDWRLPNRFELESILDLSQTAPALPAGFPFSNVALSYYWTSSYNLYYANLGVGWAVNLSDGSVKSQSWSLQPSYVWPVRGGID